MDYPPTFRNVEHSGFCGMVDASGYWRMLVEGDGLGITVPLKMWNMATSMV